MTSSSSLSSVDVLILVALKDELDALLATDAHATPDSQWLPAGDDPMPYWIRTFRHTSGLDFSIAAARPTEMREPAIAALAGSLTTSLRPRYLAMCGVCASPRADVGLGDVVVADQLFRYDMGKLVSLRADDDSITDTLLPELKAYNLKDSWKRFVQDQEGTPSWHDDIGIDRPISFRRQEHWALTAIDTFANGGTRPTERSDLPQNCPQWPQVLKRLRNGRYVTRNDLRLTKKGSTRLARTLDEHIHGFPPDPPLRLHLGSVATVANVVQDLDEGGRARIFNTIRRQRDRHIRAIEMEATAVGYVAHVSDIPHIIAKGVQDHADEDKDDRYRIFAARASARFLLEFFHSSSALSPTPTQSTSSPIISLSRLPTTRQQFMGRTRALRALDDAWLTRNAHIATVVAPGGMGKTALINRWLSAMHDKGYPHATHVVGWSFYTQGVTTAPVSGTLFLSYLCKILQIESQSRGDPYEVAEAVASHVRRRSMILVVDGLEPLQFPPGNSTGSLKDRAILLFLRELACANSGLCIVTSRLPLTDLQQYEQHVLPIPLDPLSSPEGVELLRSYRILGPDEELAAASNEFGGHPLALHLLGSYIRDIESGDISRRNGVALLPADESEGGHAFRVLRAYESWFPAQAEEPCLLRLLALFDRPIDIDIFLSFLRTLSDIPELLPVVSLDSHDLKQSFARLRDAALISNQNPHTPNAVDVHPLVREFFETQLATLFPRLWEKLNNRLYHFYEERAPDHPTTIEQMEPLFMAVIHGCRAGAHQAVLEEIYQSRIMRGSSYYAAKELHAHSELLHVLAHFYEAYDWSRPSDRLSPIEKLYVLMESGRYLPEVRGYADAAVGECYIQALPLLQADADVQLRLEILLGLCRFHRVRGEIDESAAYANRLSALLDSVNDNRIAPAVYRAHCTYLFYQGKFREAFDFAQKGASVTLTSTEVLHNAHVDINDPGISCLGYKALSLWFLGESSTALVVLNDTIRAAEELEHPHTFAVVLLIAAMIQQFRGAYREAHNYAAELIEVCAEHGFMLWWIAGDIIKAWAEVGEGAMGDESVRSISTSIGLWRRKGALLFCPYWYGLLGSILVAKGDWEKADATVEEAFKICRKTGERWWIAELLILKSDVARQLGLTWKERECLKKAERWARLQESEFFAERIRVRRARGLAVAQHQ